MQNRGANPLVILSFCFLAQVSASVAGRADTRAASQKPLLQLALTDAAGRTVAGIVCDNLKDTPPAQRNRLIIALPSSLRDVRLTARLEEAEPKIPQKTPNGKKKPPAPPCDNGNVETHRDRLVYFPPEEFNRNPNPQRLRDITSAAARTVTLHLTGVDGDGSPLAIAPLQIVLARPPVIVIHGINTRAADRRWIGKGLLPAALRAYGWEERCVDHGDYDLDLKHPETHEALSFFGNGPVEWGAEKARALVKSTLQEYRAERHLAIRRVDMVGYSYGGVIARWYLHSFRHDPNAENSLLWYVHAVNNNPNGLYLLKRDWFAQPKTRAAGSPDSDSAAEFGECPVRKLITVASMWRGVPLCNYINEMRETASNGVQLGNAPFLGSPLHRFVDGPLARAIPTRVPSMEVMAINSPWLAALDDYRENAQQKPFLDTVAYGSVAGDDNGYLVASGFPLPLLDPYTVLRFAQVPSWFPYLALERHVETDQNYTDGLVPLWSALIAENTGAFPASCIVHANHETILHDRGAQTYVMCALSSRSLPAGSLLNDRWNTPLHSGELDTQSHARKTWRFRRGEMAPTPENDLYPQIRLLGRIQPDALREMREIQVEEVGRTGATISWKTGAESDSYVILYTFQLVNFGAFDFVEAKCHVEPIGPRLTRQHRLKVTGLEPGTTYYFEAASEVYDEVDDFVAVRSDRHVFRTRY